MKLHIIPDINYLDKYKEYNLCYEYNDFFYPNILDKKGEVERRVNLYSKLDNKNNTLHGVFFDINLASVDPKIRKISEERVEESIKIATSLGCKGVILHTNYITWIKDNAYKEAWLKLNSEFYLKMLNKYKDLNLYIENMFDEEPYMLRDLCRICNHERLGCTLDVAHASISNVPIGVWFKELGPYIKHLHINDNDKIRDLHLALGDGEIDYKYIFKEYISKLADTTSILIEVNGFDKIDRSLKYLKEEIGWNMI